MLKKNQESLPKSLDTSLLLKNEMWFWFIALHDKIQLELMSGAALLYNGHVPSVHQLYIRPTPSLNTCLAL